MPESIQNRATECLTVDVGEIRRRFIVRAAELYDRPLDIDLDLAELEGRPDQVALLLAFPWMDDAELVEALWALGQVQAGGDF